ncbi:MAG: phosphatidate cytidylyltransferase [Pseudomonadota bacterium]
MNTRTRDRLKAIIRRPPGRVRRKVRRLRERFVFKREMRLRLISAMVLIPFVLFSTWLGELPFLAFVLLTAALVHYEWLRMVGAGTALPLHLIGTVGLVLAGAAAQFYGPLPAGLLVAATMVVMAALAHTGAAACKARWAAMGTLYAGLAVVALIMLRKGEAGFGAVMFVFLIAWASDTAAFFVGRNVGGPKLWPAVSPSKTWSGAAGGFVAGIVFGAAVAFLLELPVTVVTILAAGCIAAAVQAGDLVESAAKRRFAVKDAGSLIPGHGGVMDRVDGLIAAALVTAGLGAVTASETPAAGLLTLMAGS